MIFILNVVCNVQHKSDKARAFKGVQGTAPTSIPGWNSANKNFLPMVFDLGSSLVHDNGALLLFHKDDLKLKVEIRGFVKAYHFSILKKWTGINRLPITSARDASKTVSGSSLVICFILINTCI
jgi:hypothetical protein